MIRRGRIRFDYAHFNEEGLPQAQVVFQFEGSERGVAIRDFWGRYYENKFNYFLLQPECLHGPLDMKLTWDRATVKVLKEEECRRY